MQWHSLSWWPSLLLRNNLPRFSSFFFWLERCWKGHVFWRIQWRRLYQPHAHERRLLLRSIARVARSAMLFLCVFFFSWYRRKQRSCDESNSFFFLFFLSGIMPETVLTQLEKCPVDCAVIEGSYTLYVRKRKEATTKLTFCFSARSVDLKYRRQLLQPFASSLLVNEENSSMCYLLFFFFVCVCVCVCVQKWISRTRCTSH